ncbi:MULTISPECIES: SDR family oxidoreductase [unclassified Aminobacter]|uniref:SDR family NAD(P)-dependent oxidoreductase n=1 Tax=unclassified Aminobacter TaxID=2644704 RepID=UPI0004673C25|nr:MULTISPECIES: SDR family oxidoreductase [unclassified Aminobacter]TWG60656.1 NAD(P)-dependent dehydrogenase (short-subunit alcohol dehydrogenase family) [Aminobacter sp. J44]TWH31493.1 NAD(P)-dependent dehydrogenase (short-subunit alcohol dehydrogenase family) [Aminobacter sp. J15]
MKFSATFHDLAGKSVFISGGGSGIGEYLTEGFIAQGADVAFVQRSDATELCDRLEKNYGSRPLFIKCDVTDIPALQDAIAQAARANGDINVLVNNAAWDNRHPLDGFTVEEWDYMQAVNLRHYFFAIQAVAPGMRRAGGGTIVNYSSISYMMGNGAYAAYTAAKAGITGMTRGLARDLGGDNIRVNALMPGWVLTDRQRELWVDEKSLKAHIDRQCLKLEIPPEAMVEPTLFLASAASTVMTGQALVVDAGVVVTG